MLGQGWATTRTCDQTPINSNSPKHLPQTQAAALKENLHSVPERQRSDMATFSDYGNNKRLLSIYETFRDKFPFSHRGQELFSFQISYDRCFLSDRFFCPSLRFWALTLMTPFSDPMCTHHSQTIPNFLYSLYETFPWDLLHIQSIH